MSLLLISGIIFTGCAEHVLLPPKAEVVSFDQSAPTAKSEVEKSLKVNYYGNGIKDSKKFVIGAFQVRFRSDLTGKLKVKDRNCNGEFMDVYSLGGNNEALFQKVTEDLYQKFTSDLKQRGIQIVNFADMKKQSEFQIGLKGALRSGHLAELTATEISNPFYDDGIMGRLPVGDIFGQQSKAQYLIYSPTEVPSFEYTMMQGGTDDFDAVVLPGNVPAHRMDAASHLEAGVITAGFEVELMKFDYDACSIKTEIIISHTPMVRTRLTAFSAFPVGAKTGFSLFGNSINNGIVVTPKSRGGKKGTGFISSLMNGKVFGTQWSEVQDGSVVVAETNVTPMADRFPIAFKKSTEPHLQMIMSVLDHQSDYK
jgi:hypothetical protein